MLHDMHPRGAARLEPEAARMGKAAINQGGNH